LKPRTRAVIQARKESSRKGGMAHEGKTTESQMDSGGGKTRSILRSRKEPGGETFKGRTLAVGEAARQGVLELRQQRRNQGNWEKKDTEKSTRQDAGARSKKLILVPKKVHSPYFKEVEREGGPKGEVSWEKCKGGLNTSKVCHWVENIPRDRGGRKKKKKRSQQKEKNEGGMSIRIKKRPYYHLYGEEGGRLLALAKSTCRKKGGKPQVKKKRWGKRPKVKSEKRRIFYENVGETGEEKTFTGQKK